MPVAFVHEAMRGGNLVDAKELSDKIGLYEPQRLGLRLLRFRLGGVALGLAGTLRAGDAFTALVAIWRAGRPRAALISSRFSERY